MKPSGTIAAWASGMAGRAITEASASAACATAKVDTGSDKAAAVIAAPKRFVFIAGV
jgi:hypothetical protein